MLPQRSLFPSSVPAAESTVRNAMPVGQLHLFCRHRAYLLPMDAQCVPYVPESDGFALFPAAIAAMSEDSNGTNYSIRGIKKANVGRPAWAMAGLNENTRSF